MPQNGDKKALLIYEEMSEKRVLFFITQWAICKSILSSIYLGLKVFCFYLFDLVAGGGDALCDALVRPDGSGKFGIMLHNQLV